MAEKLNAGRGTYGYASVETEPHRITLRHYVGEMELTGWAAAPEYGESCVIGVGWRVKKDGTCGRQIVKPLMHISMCPTDVQEALKAAGYPAE